MTLEVYLICLQMNPLSIDFMVVPGTRVVVVVKSKKYKKKRF